ncbi:TonB-dependent receptor plug domain-containing protein [Paraglaciecola aestuariivivens]
MRLVVLLVSFISFQLCAQNKYHFDIPSQPADKALILFAQQADTTLLFPIDIAEKEITNPLNGLYDPELALVKLLEGTGLYPIKDDKGLSVKAIVNRQTKTPSSNTSEPSLDPNPYPTSIEKIAIVGTRSAPRSVIDSPVPLDIIGSEEFLRQGATNITSMLATLVPSFNVNDQPINDASSLVRPANLRGMASDHTLVLVNGKRRHRSSAITFLGGGLSDGAQGVDLSNIAASSLSQIEVLRDGAAAQYGSDAIAGVINFVLNDSNEGGRLEARVGSYAPGDGKLLQLQTNLGLPLGDEGFVNLTAEYLEQQATDRSVQRKDALGLISAGNLWVADPAQVWGSPEVDFDFKLLANMGYAFDNDNQWYSFATLAKRKIHGGFYYRNPHTRSGVYFGGYDEDENSLLLVADLDGLGQGISCPKVVISDDNVLDDPAYQSIANQDTEIGKNCFAFNEILPGGFTPQFGGLIRDLSWVMGVQGVTQNDWDYDLSVGVGYSEIEYILSQSINPSLGPASPTEFSPGLASQLEKNVNLDLFKQFTINNKYKINLATGAEWRKEYYQQKTGDLASYQVGHLAYDLESGLSQGFGVGSNGFPGYNPQSAGRWGRGNWALYTDFEIHMSDAFLFGMAARYEDFTDFGSTFDGKISTRIILNNQLTLRSSLSTGFKAPTVGQSNVVNVTTAYSANGLEDQATLPPTNPISVQLGATPLRPEESVNLGLGLVGEISPQLYFTVDYFHIRLNDRISTTSAISLSQQDIQTLVAAGVPEASSFGSAKYFTNDFDSRTQGLDLVLNYQTHLASVPTQFMFIYNWTDTNIDRVTLYQRVNPNGSQKWVSNLTEQRIKMIEDNLPAHRASVTLVQDFASFSSNLRLNYYSGFYEDHLDAAAGYDIYAGSELTVDLDVSYPINADFILAFGAKNLFDNRPDNNPMALLAGAKYPATSPIGLNGGFYYLRGIYQF